MATWLRHNPKNYYYYNCLHACHISLHPVLIYIMPYIRKIRYAAARMTFSSFISGRVVQLSCDDGMLVTICSVHGLTHACML
jgi:hypothetical protein